MIISKLLLSDLRYAIPPEHGQRLERLAAGRCSLTHQH